MDQIVSMLKEALDIDAALTKSTPEDQILSAFEMYEEWPTLEFPDLGNTILDLFTKETRESVSSSLLYELTRSDFEECEQQSIRLNSEDQLRWCMQVLNHSLTLSFVTHREYETVRGAVRIYLHWLRALTDIPDSNIPTPLLDTPEKYFRNIIDALRNVFRRRWEDSIDIPRGLAIERQATEIETILDSIRVLTHSASRKYQNEVWARALSFMLNSADLLLSEPSPSEDMGMRVGSRVVDTLFDLWFRAVLDEEIPSPTYWRTLAVLCRRWRHHVTVIESWARKLLAMTVLVCRKMYGEDYSRIYIHDDSIIPFGSLPIVKEDEEVDLLYHSWFNLLSLIDSPAHILTHDPSRNKPIHGGYNIKSDSSHSEPPALLPLCFFLATTALQRMIDVFYGDSCVPIEFKESDIFIRKWTMASQLVDEISSQKIRSEFGREKIGTGTDSSRDTRDTDGTLTEEGRASFSSSVSGKDVGRTLPDTKRTQRGRQSDRSGKNEGAVISYTSQSRIEMNGNFYQGLRNDTASIRTSESISHAPRVSDHKHSITSSEGSRPNASQFVGHALAVHPTYIPWVGDRRPKSERLLDLTMDWLLEAALAQSETKIKDGTDDVISGLSLHSVDLDDMPDAIIALTGERNTGLDKKRRSVGSSSSSMAGDSTSGDAFSSYHGDILSVDGVSAGRAAAISALSRIVCSKNMNEKLPSHQLANFLAAVYQALIEKDRLVLCSLFYYSQNIFRLGLPGVEAILPHYLFALDIVLIESSKLRLHPSIPEVEMRRACLRGLSSVVCWPTTFGMSKIPQVSDGVHLKSSASTYLLLRPRIYKTLVFSLRNETDPVNLQLTLAMCTVLMEESCSYDLGLTEEQTREMVRITTQNNTTSPEKGLCVSFVRGLVSAICDRICRPEWAGEHTISLAAIDVLNALSHIHPTILFNNKDVSTGSLIVASLCRFIETQLMKPPPLHSKDLHSTVVAAYSSIAVWLSAAPILAECESVLNTVAETIQLGVTGSKKHDHCLPEERKAASKRVLEAAEYLMYSLFCVVGRTPQSMCDERRLLYLYGPSAIDTTKFQHFIVNGDTLLSLHEASHIPAISGGYPCVIYARRSPMQGACIGIARLRPNPEGYDIDLQAPSTPFCSTSELDKESLLSQLSQTSNTSAVSSSLVSDNSGSFTSSLSRSRCNQWPSVATGSILSGVSSASIESSTINSSPSALSGSTSSTPITPVAQASRVSSHTTIGEKFILPPEFSKMTCKLDTMIRALESTKDTDGIISELQHAAANTHKVRERNVWESVSPESRAMKPKQPTLTCNSIRILLYDMGLVDREVFGTGIFYLDSGQSADFYRDLHDMVDSCPSRSLHTAHIFYIKEGQRSAIDILDNALNIQNTSADFCGFLSGLGEGIEIGVHDTWTGHWSTAYSSERKPRDEADAVDHYIIDGINHALWWANSGCELAFLMPTERSLRMFKQDLSPPAASSRRGSNKISSGISVSSDDLKAESNSYDSQQSDVFLHPSSSRSKTASTTGSERDSCPAYGGGGSSLSNPPPSRRNVDLRVLLVWLERVEDMNYFPIDELLYACDDGSERLGVKSDRPAHSVIFLYQMEPGLVQIKTKGSPSRTYDRFGEAGPLCDSMVVSLASLPSFIRFTLLNISRRNVAEIENYQFTHTKRKQAIVEFGKKYAANLTYEDFLGKLMER